MQFKMKYVVFSVMMMVLMSLASGMAWAQALEKVDINTANVQELTQLNRVGTKMASRIIEYREANGPFKTPEDIMKVKGIGQATWNLNKDRIIAGQVQTTETSASTSEPATPIAPSDTEIVTSVNTDIPSDRVVDMMEYRISKLEVKIKALQDKVAELEKKIAQE